MPAGRPPENFKPEDRHIWEPKIRELAELRCSVATIAGSFGLPYTAIRDRDDIQEIIRAGWAVADKKLMSGLWQMFNENEYNWQDAADRVSVRKTKTDAAKIITGRIDKEVPVSPAEQEKLRRLSDEDLVKEIQKYADKLK